MRTKYGEYPEYHTSLDNFSLVTTKGLTGGFNIVKKIIENLCTKKDLLSYKKKILRKKNYKYPINLLKCEPHLSKRNLYHDINFNKKNLFKMYMDFLQYADGTNSLKDIAKIIKRSLKKTTVIRNILKKNSLIK
jgi:aminopeptidase-like protein